MSFGKLLPFFTFVFYTASAEPYTCEEEYRPSNYIGSLRVPTNCNVQRLDCPPSWKSGIPNGIETSSPMIDVKFLKCHEGFTFCGYVPIDPNSGKVLGQSGVTIGAGVDLGSKSSSSFTLLSRTLVNKLEPYFGLKRNLAACAANERPLRLTQSEADTVTNAIKDDVVNEVSKRYNSDKTESAKEFSSLPRGIRTAIVSVSYQFGSPSAYPKFWSFVTKNDWSEAIAELRNFYRNPKEQAKGDLIRRNNEADIIEATLLKCNRSLDIVFLLDESGSVSKADFKESLDFVKNMIKAFSNEKLSREDGTRFGLSTFSSGYTSHFYLSSYTSQSGYLTAISRVVHKGGSTNLGRALDQILLDQFKEEKGLRPDADGLPRILIVLTDGRASDSVAPPAKNLRSKNIVIYAIGIANYNRPQLMEIANSKSHVYTLTGFSDLETFIATMTSGACYEPRSSSLNETIKTKVQKDIYLYFSYQVTISLNLEINVKDLTGGTLVYASRTNPHPYKYDADISFEFSSQIHKIIVISPRLTDLRGKRLTGVEEKRSIYVSVASDTDSALFTIEGNECNPLNCTEGTNEVATSSAGIAVAQYLMINVVMFMIGF
ncbi:vitrin-like [Dendronephthya gigantea]|uniref:vitrin-like n=1 Tax=Dendronephthya gigantea TaxID=151771 RepID=UPI00106CAB83|nr:vitrin-like [Dendronephthya gigantea]